MQAHLKRFAASFGIENLEHNPRLPNTLRILSVAEWARDEGRLEAFRDAAMKAYWREHRGVESDEEIAHVARVAGLDPERAVAAAADPKYAARVHAVSEEGLRRGVTGIPTFFIGPSKIVGCQPYDVLAAAAEAAGARRRQPGHSPA